MKRNGISLITLIITIVVVIILAAAVILTLGDNNPVNSSKLASLLKSKETMEECIKIVVADKISDTLGQATVKGIVTELDDTEIVDVSAEVIETTKNGENLKLYKVEKDDYKNKFGVQLSDTPNPNSKWYVDEKGRMFLVYDFIENVPEFMKDNETTLNKSVEPFVIITGQELEESIIESIEIELPSESVGIGEDKKISVNVSNVKNLSYCQWVINNSSDKLGTEDENLYPYPLESNNAEISLANITKVGNYYLHMLIVTSTTKVEKISSRIVVEKKPDVWDGTVATSFASGTGTELDPYIIETAEQLAYLSSRVKSANRFEGKYIKMVNSIDLNNIEWTPIGNAKNYTTYFHGNFDGGNNLIYNLNITGEYYQAGLFGRCEDATIKNLTIESGSINIPSAITPDYIGGIAGIMTDGEISNCVNKAIINVNASTSAVGGIVAKIITGTSNTSPSFKINNCYNYGDITSSTAVSSGLGGVVGYCDGKVDINNCGNYGDIYDPVVSNIGGILGNVSKTSNINQSFNEGDIYGKNEVSGILGGYSAGIAIVINECYNSGDITAVTNYVSGICAKGGSSLKINYCYNTGTIKALGTNRVSGIADYGAIKCCYNAGNIIYAGNNATYNGPIAAYSCTVSKCYYLQCDYQQGVYGKANSSTTVESKSEAEFKKNSGEENAVVDLLNAGLEVGSEKYVVNGGYPILKWQLNSNN